MEKLKKKKINVYTYTHIYEIIFIISCYIIMYNRYNYLSLNLLADFGLRNSFSTVF